MSEDELPDAANVAFALSDLPKAVALRPKGRQGFLTGWSFCAGHRALDRPVKRTYTPVVKLRRRELIVTFVLGLLVVPPAAEAEQAGKVPRIVFLTTTSPESSPTTDAFRRGLRDLGYVEGQNLAVEWRWGRGSTERFPDFVAEAVRLKVDLIVAANDPAGYAAQKATKAIPIVIALMGDPVGSGFVASLARPGGNITGLTGQGLDLIAKRLQLFKEAVPNVSRMALLLDMSSRVSKLAMKEAEGAAPVLGVQLQPREISKPSDLDTVFASIIREGAHAVFTAGGTMFYANRGQLADHALRSRLPMACDSAESVEAGCLMTYATSLTDLFRRAAAYVDKILKGAKPADLPVEQPTKFELVINLKTAKALGLTIPPVLLLRADRIIE